MVWYKSVFFTILHALWIVLVWVIQLFFNPKLVVERVPILVESLRSSQLTQLKIVQLTDIHFDDRLPKRISDELLDQVVQTTNNEKPDLILITGDFVERRTEPIKLLAEKWLSKLKARYGTYGVLGNHDHKEPNGTQNIRKCLLEHGIKILQSEIVYPIDGDSSIELVGVGDLYNKSEYNPSVSFANVDPSKDKNTTRIVMSHNPDSAVDFTNWKVDLQLSGHSHGGQICFPFSRKPVLQTLFNLYNTYPLLRRIIPRQIFVLKNWDYCSGLHQIPRHSDGIDALEPNRLYVSRGLATHPPLRLFCPPELTVLYLSY